MVRGPEKKVNQFALPRGLGGSLVGYLMALFNADMKWVVVNALILTGTESVMEIGAEAGSAAHSTVAPSEVAVWDRF